jgi:hypothetical protein
MKNSNRKDSYLKYLRNITINKYARNGSQGARIESNSPIRNRSSSLNNDYKIEIEQRPKNTFDNKENNHNTSKGPLDGSVSSFASLAAIAPLGFTNSGK